MLIPINILAIFFSVSILLSIIPGPDNIFVFTQSSIRGKLAGWVITLGLCTGLVGHSLLVATGVAMIFRTSYLAFTILKLIGGAYLMYLAYLEFQAQANIKSPSENITTPLFQLYKRGIIMNMTNPKVSMFFLSFLPQFANPLSGSFILQIVMLGLIFIISALMVFGIIIHYAGYLGERLQHSLEAKTIMSRIAGMVYVVLGVRLIMASI